MKIFKTERLIIRKLKESDSDDYYDMMGNPKVMNMIPREVMTRVESDNHLKDHMEIDTNNSETRAWGIQIKGGTEFLGICAFLKNDNGEDEIGYRIREKYWGKGIGTEIAKGLISYGFDRLKMKKITADVAIENHNSVKILEKLMTTVKDFFNESDNCTDRRYEILKSNWKQ